MVGNLLRPRTGHPESDDPARHSGPKRPVVDREAQRLYAMCYSQMASQSWGLQARWSAALESPDQLAWRCNPERGRGRQLPAWCLPWSSATLSIAWVAIPLIRGSGGGGGGVVVALRGWGSTGVEDASGGLDAVDRYSRARPAGGVIATTCSRRFVLHGQAATSIG